MSNRAAQPDWELPLLNHLRPTRSIGGNGIGDGSFTRASVAYGWKKESVVTQFAVTAANARCSFADGQAWYWDTDNDISVYANTGHKIELIDDAGLRAVGILGAAGSGEAWGDNIVTDGDFPDFDNWTNLGTWAISSGKARVSGNGSNNDLAQGSAEVEDIGKFARIIFTTSSQANIEDLQFRVNYLFSAASGGFYTDINGTQLKVDGEHTLYSSVTGVLLSFRLNSTAADGQLDIDDLSANLMTDCAGEGVHVNKVSDPTTEGWDYDASFDFDAIAHAVIVKDDLTSDRLAWQGVNMPRLHATDGILLEPAGTNLCTYSAKFEEWDVTRATATDNAATGPDGTSHAATLILDATAANTHSVSQSIAKESFTDDVSTTFSVFAKAAGLSWAYLELRDKDQDDYSGYFNLASGVVGTKTADASGIESVGNGWYHIWITQDIFHGVNDPLFIISLAEANEDRTIDGDSANGLALWGAQIEDNKKFPSSPIYTEASEVTRATESGYPRWTLPTNMFAETLGEELVTGGDCATDNFDGTGGDWTYNAGTDAYDAVASGDTLYQYINITTGPTYRVEVTATVTSGTLYVDLGSSIAGQRPSMTSTGSYVFYLRHLEGSLRIRFYGGTFTGSVDDISVKEVTNSWNDMPPHGTVVMDWEPGWDQGDAGETYSGILACRVGYQSLIYTKDTTGYLYAHDDTQTSSVVFSYAIGTPYKLILQYGYLTDNVTKMRVGYFDGTTLSWDATPGDWDGAYDMGAYLQLATTLLGPMKIKNIHIYKRILSDAEINALG